jgi:hypothetical protein
MRIWRRADTWMLNWSERSKYISGEYLKHHTVHKRDQSAYTNNEQDWIRTKHEWVQCTLWIWTWIWMVMWIWMWIGRMDLNMFGNWTPEVQHWNLKLSVICIWILTSQVERVFEYEEMMMGKSKAMRQIKRKKNRKKTTKTNYLFLSIFIG